MESTDKIDLAIRAGLVAKSVLQLMACNSKTLARLIVAETVDLVVSMDKKIKALPED